MRSNKQSNGRPGSTWVWLLVLALPFATAACKGNALSVVDPERATPANVTPDVAFAGAVSDFQHGWSGQGGESLLSAAADFTDEFHNSGTFPTRTRTDERNQFSAQDGNTSDNPFVWLQQARSAAISAEQLITTKASANDPRISQLKSYVGYVYDILGEDFCSNVPFSSAENYAPATPGQPLATATIFQAAADTFAAAASAAQDAQAKDLALVGQARALLNIAKSPADYQKAAALVQSVPTDFAFFVEHSTAAGMDENGIHDLQDNGRYSISDVEGGNGMNFRSANDPRVPWARDSRGGFTPSIPLYFSLRYPLKSSNVVLADGIEARLIEAESDLNNGNYSGWLTTLNNLRANVQTLMYGSTTAGQPRYDDPTNTEITTLSPDSVSATTLSPIADPGTMAARVDTMFRERAFWLFLTDHRLGDLRRLIRNYGRGAETVFPTGTYFKGGPYGTDVAFQMVYNERNNPNYSLSMCNVKQP